MWISHQGGKQMSRSRPAIPVWLSTVGKALCYLALFFGTQILLNIIYLFAGAIYYSVGGVADLPTLLDLALAFTLECAHQISFFSNLIVLMILVTFFSLRKKNLLREVGLVRPHGVRAAYGVALVPLLYLAVNLLLSALPEAWLEGYLESSATLVGTGLLPFLSVAVLAPVTEEIIFRGLILSRLGRALPIRSAALLTALLFAVCHGQIVWMAYAFLMGGFFCLLTTWSGSILPALFAHLIFNSVGQVALYLPAAFVESGVFPLSLLALSAAACGVIYLINCQKSCN